MINDTCTNCDGLLNERLRPGLGIDWQCAWCGQAGTHFRNGQRTARLVTVKGDPARYAKWVAAESMPYAERVARVA
ncbi:MAG TPA: hypothetical protein VGO53_16295 [Steroidobacteraceae bacterium]|jgi:hypothetical protein|nr:hypothetical protein [Steroidobacteraceae bacterium]